jgi:hypothetical protein
MIIKPTLLLDTCALKHLDKLSLGRRPLIGYLLNAFELRVSHEVYDELRRHVKGMEVEELIKKKKAEWRMRHCLDDSCLKQLLPDLPATELWYCHNGFHPTNQDHLFSKSGNAGERELFLLFLELGCSGRTPIFLSDDLKACRVAIRDLIGWKVRVGLLWITLDFVIYLTLTGLKRAEGRKVENRFRLAELRGVIRDLVLKVSGDQILQQQLITHYQQLAEMIFNLVDGSEAFTILEKRYGKTKYR